MNKQLVKVSLTLWAILACGSQMEAQQRPATASIPAGTLIAVRMNENLSSEKTKAGERFTGALAQPVVVNGRTIFSTNSPVTGQVVEAKESGRLSDSGVLELRLISIGSTPVSSRTFVIKGASHTKNNVTKIGGGTAAGAIIGGIVGGGKGAAIGAGVGAGAGTATAAATGKKPAIVESEAVLMFQSGPVQESPVRWSDNRGSGNDHDRSDYVSRRRSHHDDDDDDDDDDRDDHHDRRYDSRGDYGYTFGDRDREVLYGCLSGYDFESLPPGIQKKLARGGTLPPGQAKKLRRLPDSCTVRLPRLPRDVERIIFGDRVILVRSGNYILDILVFER